MLVLESNIGEYFITIMCDDPSKDTYLKIVLRSHGIILVDDYFKNARIASANLVASVSMSHAVDFLSAHHVPKTHPLWDLNHSDYWIR